MHGDYRLGNVMVGEQPPARVVSVFDWELATIGDPLADVGYMTITWAQADDPEDLAFGALSAATRREGFPTRDELVARYEERSGRSVESLAWYQALAIWKAAVFMEGNYKAYAEGRSDDEYLGLFDEGVPALAEQARQIARDWRSMKGLLVDFGGVLTTNVFDSFRAVLPVRGPGRRRVPEADVRGQGGAAPAAAGRDGRRSTRTSSA